MPGTLYKATFKDPLDMQTQKLLDRLEDLVGKSKYLVGKKSKYLVGKKSNDFVLELHPPLKPPSC